MPARATASASMAMALSSSQPLPLTMSVPMKRTKQKLAAFEPSASPGEPPGKHTKGTTSGFPWFASILRQGSATEMAADCEKLLSNQNGPDPVLSPRHVRLVSVGEEDEMMTTGSDGTVTAPNSKDSVNSGSDNQASEQHPSHHRNSSSSNNNNNRALSPPRSRPRAPKADEKDILAWENPSYLVKDLDTGESYRVEEIDQQFTLVTLDSVAQQRGEVKDKQDANDTSSSAYLLSLYTADETADIEFEEDAQEIEIVRARSDASSSMDLTDECVVHEPMECRFEGCQVMHQRPSGFCANHEVVAKEEEDLRAQALYLIPMGARAEFVKISGHGLAHDASNRLYTVYVIEMRCAQSGASWNVYRRYQEFKTLNDCLRPLGVRVPLLPPKRLIGSFEPDFVARRQHELSEWLHSLLDYDRVDESAKNPHLLEDVRKFLTAKADQSPFLIEQLPVKRSRQFGDSFMEDGDERSNHRTTLKDFKMIQVIGRGSFGKVVLVGHRETKKLYAMKILSKDNIVKRKQVEHTRTERRVLGYTRHPFIVGLHYAFQTAQRLYFVLDYCPGGELFYHLSRMKKLPEHMACFYAAEITLALEHLHGLGVVYRDLKPENILLTKDGHIMLADFGLAKEGIRDGVYGTNSLCGTPEYLPPEILDRLGHGTAVDWWNLGMVLYEMLTGLPPWYTNDRKRLFERLRSARLHFPPYVSRRAEALIRQLLNRNPAERLGARGADQVKNHLFFETIDWNRLVKKQIPPPFRPCHTALNDGETPLNFEAEFTRLPLPSAETQDGASSSHATNANATPSRRLRRADSDTFQGFTYENPSYLESLAADEQEKK